MMDETNVLSVVYWFSFGVCVQHAASRWKHLPKGYVDLTFVVLLVVLILCPVVNTYLAFKALVVYWRGGRG